MNKILLLIFVLVTHALAQSSLTFEEWEIKHAKVFKSVRERNLRRKIFHANRAEILAHNANFRNTFKKSLNEFSHMEAQEFIDTHCKTVLPKDLKILTTADAAIVSSKAITFPFGNYTTANAPVTVDYTQYMLSVQDQGQCGCCWAFSVTAQLEAMLKIRNTNLNTILAPQYLLDCDLGDSACDGGWPGTALNWLQSSSGGNNSLPSWANYNYTSVQGKCKTNVPKIPLGINTVSQKYFAGNETALKLQIANYGPTIVAMNATSAFQSYKSGILYDSLCPVGANNCDDVNHAVIVVGYGKDPRFGDYWKVRNSWGPDYGENGYIRMARNRGNNCNVGCWAVFAN